MLENTIDFLISEADKSFRQALETEGKGEIGDGWYPLGMYLTAIRAKTNGVDQFKAHCETIGISSRVAYYLIGLYQHLKQQQIAAPPGISWRKLAEVELILRWDNQDEIFSLCRKHSREELKTIAREWRK